MAIRVLRADQTGVRCGISLSFPSDAASKWSSAASGREKNSSHWHREIVLRLPMSLMLSVGRTRSRAHRSSKLVVQTGRSQADVSIERRVAAAATEPVDRIWIHHSPGWRAAPEVADLHGSPARHLQADPMGAPFARSLFAEPTRLHNNASGSFVRAIWVADNVPIGN